jgi:hypothetical protein
MKDLISKKYKHLLYKDECPELTDFLILKYAEVYRNSETELKLLIFSPKKASQLRKMGVISDIWVTDDNLYISTTDNRNLDALIKLGATKRRINKKGNTLKSLEEKLGHKILTFNPKLKN